MTKMFHLMYLSRAFTYISKEQQNTTSKKKLQAHKTQPHNIESDKFFSFNTWKDTIK